MMRMAVRNGASDDAMEGQMLSHFSALSQTFKV
jgi:hypothetical protein